MDFSIHERKVGKTASLLQSLRGSALERSKNQHQGCRDSFRTHAYRHNPIKILVYT